MTDTGWHLDKRVPISLIGALLLQTAGFVWWVSQTSARLDQVENWQDKNDRLSERIVRIESKLDILISQKRGD